jgi:hypothetical protein
MTTQWRCRAPVVIAVLAVMVALSGTAVAANGRLAHLGRNNSATRTTTLRDSRGTPLSVHSRHGSPPLSVDGNTTQVPDLNVAKLGGDPAASYGANVEVFTHPGRFAITVPAGLHHALVTASGGGGGGGGAFTGDTSAGGGQGGTGVVWLTIEPGQHYVAVVGAGGAAGTAAAGASGGVTTVSLTGTVGITGVGAGLIVSATGGAGGGAPGDCSTGSSVGGKAGTATGPVAQKSSVSVVAIRSAPAAAGRDFICQMGPPEAGPGGGVAGVAGSGGHGSDPTQAQVAGSPGFVMVEFFT